MKDALIRMVQFMFERAHRWNEWLKGEVMCPLFKKGDRRVKGNYRGGGVACDGEQGASESVREKDEMVGGAHELDG